MSDRQEIVTKLWSYCDVLRDDGLSYQDYLEQITFLLFLKMTHERVEMGILDDHPIPEGYRWPQLVKRSGDELYKHYRETLEVLGEQPGMVGVIYSKAQNKIQDPAKLRKLVADLIDEENWSAMSADVKGDAYEGLLEKNAEDRKSGAGQYFTPRVLIDAMVKCIDPEPDETVCDPAVGTGGFLVSAYERIVEEHSPLNPDQKKHLKLDAFYGVEIVDEVARLCAMNLLLHGIGPTDGEAEPPIEVNDSLRADPGDRYEIVMTNPPFGKKSSILTVTEEGETERQAVAYVREDFWAETKNKQLNFLQHVKTLLDVHGRAAVVVPDNVLFEGGAGETVRRKLLEDFHVHTLLRLPTGIFYATGVKANVLFFDKKPARADPWTDKLWIYDLRTNKHFTLKRNPIQPEDLEEFVELYKAGDIPGREETWDEEDNPDGRWRAYDCEELIQRDKVNLDIFWIKDESLEDTEDLPPPEEIAEEIVEDLRAAVEDFEAIAEDLG